MQCSKSDLLVSRSNYNVHCIQPKLRLLYRFSAMLKSHNSNIKRSVTYDMFCYWHIWLSHTRKTPTAVLLACWATGWLGMCAIPWSEKYRDRQIFRIGTVLYSEGLWRMRRHGPVIAHCNDSENFPRDIKSDGAFMGVFCGIWIIHLLQTLVLHSVRD